MEKESTLHNDTISRSLWYTSSFVWFSRTVGSFTIEQWSNCYFLQERRTKSYRSQVSRSIIQL